MKKIRMAFLALATIALLATGCGGGGGGGSDDDDATPVAENGSAGTGSGSSASGSGSGDSGGGSASTSVPEGLVPVQGATFDGTTAITGSSVFISGRTITIPNLLVCDHEVTQAEYQSVMGSNPSYFSGANRPVEQVSWYDAVMYCNKRSAAEGKTPCYEVDGETDTDLWGYTPNAGNRIRRTITCDFDANGYRLPTEAEWEYLARGGNLANSGQTDYSGDGNIENVAWCGSNSGGKTHEVRKKAANSLGLYDMSGNVWEWCWDWYDTITASTPPTGASSGYNCIMRGGNWLYTALVCTVSCQDFDAPGACLYYYGFRVVCSRSESGSGSGGSGSGGTNTSVPEGFVLVQGTTFNGTTAVTGSSVFISGRTITIPNLLVCDHEVTQGEYEQYCSYGGDNSPSDTYGKGNNYPAYYVSWYDALVYCNTRSIAEQRTPCYTINNSTNPNDWGSVPKRSSDPSSTWDAASCNFSANGYRLPTEAEWEYLARGGNLANSEQMDYSGSNTIGDVAWYAGNAYYFDSSSPEYGTHQVKTKNPNGKSLYDMSGNVFEWCWDWHGSISASTPSTGAASGSDRIIRGGAWSGDSSYCKVSRRVTGSGPCGRGDIAGFRVVCSMSE